MTAIPRFTPDPAAPCAGQPMGDDGHDWVEEGLVHLDADAYARERWASPTNGIAGTGLVYVAICTRCGDREYFDDFPCTVRPMPPTMVHARLSALGALLGVELPPAERMGLGDRPGEGPAAPVIPQSGRLAQAIILADLERSKEPR